MGSWDQFSTVWPLVVQAPLAFVSIGLALLAAGWTAGRFMFSQTISILKERNEAYRQKLDGATPDEARHKIAKLEEAIEKLSDPRLLSIDQLDKMAFVLRSHKGRLNLIKDVNSSEATGLHSQMRKFFEQQGWIVEARAGQAISDPPSCGLVLFEQTPTSDDEKLVAEALSRAGIRFEKRTTDAHETWKLFLLDSA